MATFWGILLHNKQLYRQLWLSVPYNSNWNWIVWKQYWEVGPIWGARSTWLDRHLENVSCWWSRLLGMFKKVISERTDRWVCGLSGENPAWMWEGHPLLQNLPVLTCTPAQLFLSGPCSSAHISHRPLSLPCWLEAVALQWASRPSVLQWGLLAQSLLGSYINSYWVLRFCASAEVTWCL